MGCSFIATYNMFVGYGDKYKSYGLPVAKCAIVFTEGITKWMREIQSKNREEVECVIILTTKELI